MENTQKEAQTKTKSLWNLALKSSLDALKMSIDQLEFTSLYALFDIFDKDEDVEDFLTNLSHIQKLIEFHKPHREILNRSKKFDDYRNVVNEWLDGLKTLHMNTVLKMVLWLCFENEEATQLKHWSILPENVFAMAFIKKAQIKLTKCKVAAMELGSSGRCKSNEYEDLSSTLSLIPNVEDLRIQIWSSQEATYRKKLYEEVISQFQCLKSFKTGFFRDTKDVDDFCYFVDESPKILEVLEIQYDIYDSMQHFAKLVKHLNQLPFLNVFNLDLRFGSPPINDKMIKSIKKVIPNSSVKTMKLWSEDPLILKLINKCFTGIKYLTLIYRRPIKSLEVLKGKSLQNLKNIEYLQLRFDYSGDPTIRLSTIWNIFPNLKVYDTTHIKAECEDISPVTSLEKLIVLSGYVSPPSILLKMPNLKEFVMLTDANYAESAKEWKPYLPSKCKISKTDDFEKVSFNTCLALNSL